MCCNDSKLCFRDPIRLTPNPPHPRVIRMFACRQALRRLYRSVVACEHTHAVSSTVRLECMHRQDEGDKSDIMEKAEQLSKAFSSAMLLLYPCSSAVHVHHHHHHHHHH
jgi:hypothetical protein